MMRMPPSSTRDSLSRSWVTLPAETTMTLACVDGPMPRGRGATTWLSMPVHVTPSPVSTVQQSISQQAFTMSQLQDTLIEACEMVSELQGSLHELATETATLRAEQHGEDTARVRRECG